jgi:hypothetical protein
VEFWAQEIALRRMKLPEFFIDYWREVSRRGTTRVQTKHGLTDEYHIGRGVRVYKMLKGGGGAWNAAQTPPKTTL